jgi:GT2 family glycosyltransferase
MQCSENLKVGICGVQLIQEDGQIARSCTRFPSVTNWVAHAVGLDRIFPGSAHRMANWDHDSSRVVDHVMGSFFLVRRVVFDALQGFDDRFFVYLEDLDFSKRAKALGWTSFYVADTRAFHAGGGTSRQVKAIRLFYSLRSRILYSIKHFSWFSALLILLATLIVEPCSRTVFAILKRSWSSLKETWCAYGMLYRWLPALSIKGR